VKYWAILLDSFREAIDTKVFYVMVAVSVVLSLILASVSFTPGSCTELSELYTTLPLNIDPSEWSKLQMPGAARQQATRSVWTLDKVEPLDGAPDGPESLLRFRLHESLSSKEEAAQVRQDPTEAENFLRERFATLGDWKVLEVTHIEPVATTGLSSVGFEVQTRPTRATRRAWPSTPSLFFGSLPLTGLKTVPLGIQVWFIEDTLVNGLGAWVAILISVVITAFFIPNMLRKGSVDLLLVKPIHRVTLLAYKYVGGLTFIFLNTAAAVLGVWLVLGWRSGIWAPGFLLTILIITVFFAILYAVSTLAAVLSRSAIVAILVTCAAWGFLWGVGKFYVLPDSLRQFREVQNAAAKEKTSDTPNKEEPEESWVKVGKVLHFILPRTSDLDYLTSRLLFRDVLAANQFDPHDLKTAKFSWRESLIVDGIFIAVLLGLACIRFATKDY
jgi:ABC-type transport system involved in multi-copper enzyme maturation permease subunit